MRGGDNRKGELFSYVDLAALKREFAALYAFLQHRRSHPSPAVSVVPLLSKGNP